MSKHGRRGCAISFGPLVSPERGRTLLESEQVFGNLLSGTRAKSFKNWL